MSARARGRRFSPEVAGGDLLALRPVNALHALRRAGADGEACPLSLTWIARSLAALRATLPIACAPIPAVARAVLVAAHEAGAVVGLSPLPGAAPEAWFASVARAADELAPRLPIFLSAEVSVGEAVEDLPRACAAAHRLVDAGITHLAIDVTQVPLARRSQAAAEVAVPAAERELAVDCVLPAECGRDPEVAAAFLEEFEGWGARADLVSLRLAAAGGAAEARRQGAVLDAVAAACAGRPVMRRGPLAGRTLSALRGAALRLSADGGRTLAAGLRALPRRPGAAGRASRGVVELSAAAAARVEALAYGEAASLIERLGAAGTARALRGAPR